MLTTLLLASLVFIPVEPNSPTEDSPVASWAADRDARMQWWREARFGMFIHFGLYSAAGGMWEGKRYEQHYAEWIQNWAAVPSGEYAKQLKPKFQPEVGFAEKWADLAKEAGMRYAVLTAKHHEGFTLFESKEPYSLSNPITGGTNISPPGRDLAREFADSMRSRGLRAGFYYSLLDWQHPDAYEMALPGYPKPQAGAPTGPRDPAKYVAYLRAHVNELLTHYGPLSTLWFDYSDATHQGEAWGSTQLLADLRAKQPHILVNNRLFNGLENKLGDYGTPEKYVPPTGLPGMDWEVNHTLNESYGFSAHDVAWKDTPIVIRLLCDVVSKGGNLLLNIGPDATGRIPSAAEATLRGVGAWMRTHSSAIYGTTASPFGRLAWGRATQKPGKLYLMIFDWPLDGSLRLPLRNEVKANAILGTELRCESQRDSVSGGWILKLPARDAFPGGAPDPACSVVEVEIDGTADPLPYAVTPGARDALTLLPHDAVLSEDSLRIEQTGVIGDVKYNLGYWTNAQAFVSWPIQTAKAQRYDVIATIACKDESAGSVITIDCGGESIELKVQGTGGWGEYRHLLLGTLDIPAGSSTLTLRAKSKPGEAVLNLRSLFLPPSTP